MIKLIYSSQGSLQSVLSISIQNQYPALANALASFSTATLQFPPFYPFALSYEPQTIVFAVYMRVPPLLFFPETYNALTSSTH